VAPTEVAGQSRGPRGRWAVLLHRRSSPVPPATDPVPPSEDAEPALDEERPGGSADVTGA